MCNKLFVNLKTFLSKHWDEIIVLIIFCVVFYFITFFRCSDIWKHMQFAINRMDDGTLMRGNFLLYLLTDMLSGFSGDCTLAGLSLSFILAFSNTLRYKITKDSLALKSKWTNNILAFSMLFIYILPFSYILGPLGLCDANQMYWTFTVPTVWHNSTTIMLFPFAFLLFLLSMRQLEDYDSRRNIWICLLVSINVFIKPSFFFCFCCVYPIMLFYRYGFSSFLWKSLISVIIGLVCLAYVYMSIYELGDDGSSIAFNADVLTVKFWSNNFIKLLCSIVFPLIYFIFNVKKCLHDKEFWYVSLLFVVSIAISYIFIELGPRYGHGNFLWQTFICLWLVYYYVLKNISPSIISIFKGEKISASNIVLIILYICCFFTGVFYFIKYMITNSYF